MSNVHLWHKLGARDAKDPDSLPARFMTAFKQLKLDPQQIASLRQQVNLNPENAVASILAGMVNGGLVHSGNAIGMMLIASLIRSHRDIPMLAGELQRELEEMTNAQKPEKAPTLSELAIEEVD